MISNCNTYGFSFEQENAGGFGAVLHAAMLALHYARLNKHDFAFVKEGLRVPCFNGDFMGYVDDLPDQPEKNFHSYFKSFPHVVSEKDVVAVWRSCPNGFYMDTPNNISRIEWYSKLLQELYILNDDIADEVNKRVQKTGFNPDTDIVLHVRRADKINGHMKETGVLPLSEYFDETMNVVNKFYKEKGRDNVRIFLCTDDKDIIDKFTKDFAVHNIPVVYDNSETEKPIRELRLTGKITKSEAWEENIVAMVNLDIMSKGLHLIGGRMSYFFRIGELLRYPLSNTVNIKDQEKFGKAPYAEPDEFFVNPMWEGRYEDFVNPELTTTTINYSSDLDTNFIITVDKFMSDEGCRQIKNDMPLFKNEWWVHAILPSNDKWERTYLEYGHKDLQNVVAIAEKAADDGNFAYHFQRTIGGHYVTCNCYTCRLKKTVESYDVIKALSHIVGKKVIGMGETFASKYDRNDFLTTHHDKNKGDYAFILSLTSDWNPVHGGNTHFLDDQHNIYKTVSPKFNTMTIFKLSPEKQMNHFVSKVCGPNSRYAYTGWFFVEK